LSDSPSINELIDAGNNLREEHGNDVLARLAIKQITFARELLKEKLENKQKNYSQEMIFRQRIKKQLFRLFPKKLSYY
jgi:hypothetical protein